VNSRIINARTPLSAAELQAHLTEQLGFLERSTEAFDNGFEDEAKRLAVTIRTLVYDGKSSHSLLEQLGMKSSPLVDTSSPFNPSNVASHHRLTSLRIDAHGGKFVANLDSGPRPARNVSFDNWWTKPVIVDGKRKQFSRKDLVLIAANQDGGAHVDPSLDDAYAALSRKNTSNYVVITPGGGQPKFPERAAIRQIAHELLKTCRPGYRK